MAKKKPAGTDLGFSLLVQAFRFGIAWSGRFFTELEKNSKLIYQKYPTFNTKFDNWCITKKGSTLSPIPKTILIILCFIFIIPIMIFISFVKSF